MIPHSRLCFDWDRPDDPHGNLRHVASQGFTVEEVQYVLMSEEGWDVWCRHAGLPGRLGWTHAGRFILVVYLYEGAGELGIVRPVTAHEVDPPRLGART